MKITATVTGKQIRDALYAAGMTLDDLGDNSDLDIEDADVDDSKAIDELGPCPECNGEGLPDVEPVIDHNLIGDFIAALQAGDMLTARGLVYRVFDDTSDARAADSALCRCTA